MGTRKLTRRAFVAGTGATGLSAVLASRDASARGTRPNAARAASAIPAAQPKSGGIVVDYLGKDPGELDPTSPAALSSTGFLAQHIYDQLVWYDHDLAIMPRLAESWQWVDPV